MRTRRALFTILTLMAAICTAGPAGAATTPVSDQWVMGYYVGYQRDLLPPDKIAWQGMTHIIMGRVTARADGSLNTTFDVDATAGPALAEEVAQRAHAAGKKAILMLGGDDNGTQIRAAVTTNRSTFVANLVSTMRELGYDGIDVDWENDIDWTQMIAFVRDLRAAAPTAILTMPVGALNINYDVVDPHLVTVAASLDRVSLMSYYPSTSWAGSGWLSWFNSPLSGAKAATPVSIAASLAAYAKAGIPKAKLAMGASFYATCYTGGITVPNQSTENGVTIEGGDNEYMLSELYGATGVYNALYRHWSSVAKAPYLSLPKAERHGCRYISYEDEASLIAKGAYSRANGYGGIIIWTINQGNVVSHGNPSFLIDALDRGFLHPDITQTGAISVLPDEVWLKTGALRRFAALVTGMSSGAVTWSVVGTACGSITTTGIYRAPTRQKTCAVRATSVADPSLTAQASVTVSNAVWAPVMTVSRAGTWWVEATVHDADAQSMSFLWPDGTTAAMQHIWTESGTGYPVFAANYGFPLQGGSYPAQVRAANGRIGAVTLQVPTCNADADGLCQ